MYVITGAAGNIGKIVAHELLSNGKQVRVIGRSTGKLNEFIEKGAEAMVGDVMDPLFVKRAFNGATAVYCMIPPNTHSKDFRDYQGKIAKNYVEAVHTNFVKYALLLSSIGAHLQNGAGVVDGLSDMEEEFGALKEVNVLNLRPAYFMENLYGQIDIIKNMGVTGSAVKPDIKVPMVATKDIAAVVAKHLINLDFKGNSVEFVLGPRDISYNEIAEILGKAIGKADLKYVQFSYMDAKKGMVQSGFASENVADLLNGLSEATNLGKTQSAHQRTPLNSTPTTLEDFVMKIAYAYSISEAVVH